MDVNKNRETEKNNRAQAGKGVKAIPDVYAGATPYLYVNMASAALEFYQKAFNAKVLISIKDDKNRIVHAEMEIGKARIMLSDEFPEQDCYAPRDLGGTTSGIMLFFEDSEKVFSQAIAAGARELSKVEDLFCGDRGGKILDPFGHQWFIYTHTEDVSYDEMKKRGEKLFKDKVLH